jgi:hypothetical protein
MAGKDNYAADQEAVRLILSTWPEVRAIGPVNRAFLRRAVRYLVGDAAAAITESLDEFMDGIYWRMMSPLELLNRLPTARNRRYQAAHDQVLAAVSQLISDARVPGRDDVIEAQRAEGRR